MVKLASIASLLLLAIPAVWASPTPELEERHYNDCIPDEDAKKLLKQFVSLFEKLDENVAKKILVPDFVVQSASLNFLFGIKGGPTSTSRDQLITGTKADEATRTMDKKIIVLDADHTCNKEFIYFRWHDNTGPTPLNQLYGFDELILTFKDGRWQIKTDYSEFNNAILLYNAGLFPCNASNSPTPGT